MLRPQGLLPLIVSYVEVFVVFCLFSAKGGAGCSVSAAALALLCSSDEPTLLVDLHGELSMILGVEPATEGLSDWFRLDEPAPDVLHRLEVVVRPGLSLLPRGACRSPGRPAPYRLLSRLLATDGRRVIVDAGTHGVPAVSIVSEASQSLLVTRACYLALRAAERGPTPDGVILVEEEGRKLGLKDVNAAVGANVVVQLRWHRDVARAVDTGLLAARFPRALAPLAELL